MANISYLPFYRGSTVPNLFDPQPWSGEDSGLWIGCLDEMGYLNNTNTLAYPGVGDYERAYNYIYDWETNTGTISLPGTGIPVGATAEPKSGMSFLYWMRKEKNIWNSSKNQFGGTVYSLDSRTYTYSLETWSPASWDLVTRGTRSLYIAMLPLPDPVLFVGLGVPYWDTVYTLIPFGFWDESYPNLWSPFLGKNQPNLFLRAFSGSAVFYQRLDWTIDGPEDGTYTSGSGYGIVNSYNTWSTGGSSLQSPATPFAILNVRAEYEKALMGFVGCSCSTNTGTQRVYTDATTTWTFTLSEPIDPLTVQSFSNTDPSALFLSANSQSISSTLSNDELNYTIDEASIIDGNQYSYPDDTALTYALTTATGTTTTTAEMTGNGDGTYTTPLQTSPGSWRVRLPAPFDGISPRMIYPNGFASNFLPLITVPG